MRMREGEQPPQFLVTGDRTNGASIQSRAGEADPPAFDTGLAEA